MMDDIIGWLGVLAVICAGVGLLGLGAALLVGAVLVVMAYPWVGAVLCGLLGGAVLLALAAVGLNCLDFDGWM